MTRERMLEAREHILNKRYSQARAILNTIDHPKAKEWLAKLDEVELGDPFQGIARPQTPPEPPTPQPNPQTRNAAQGARLLQSAAAIFLQNDWQVRYQTEMMVQFEKKRGVNTFLAALLVLLLSLLGTAIVCLGIATAKTERVTLEADVWGKLRVTTSKGTYSVSDALGVTEFAQSVRAGATYAGAIAGGIIVFILVMACQMSSTPIYYFR